MDSGFELTRRGTLAAVAGSVAASITGCLGGAQGSPPSYLPEKTWEFETSGPIWGVPAVTDGLLFFGSDDGYMYAVEGSGTEDNVSEYFDFPMSGYDLEATNAPNGVSGPLYNVSERWRFGTNGPVRAAPVVTDGDLMFGSGDNYFYSVDVETGRENWSYDTGNRIMSGASVHDGVVYFASGYWDAHPYGGGGGVYALAVEDGSEIWSVEYDSGVLSPPIYHDGLVYHGDQDESFVARDAQTGEVEWRYEAEDHFCACRAGIGDDNVYIGCQDGRTYAFDLYSGEKQWSFQTDAIVVSSPTVAEDSIHFGSRDNNLYSVSKSDGEELWRFETNGEIVSSPAYRDGLIYVGSLDGMVYAIEEEEGELVWGFETGSWVKSSALLTEDLIYIGADDSKMYALKNREVFDAVHDEHIENVSSRNVTQKEIHEKQVEGIYEDV